MNRRNANRSSITEKIQGNALTPWKAATDQQLVSNRRPWEFTSSSKNFSPLLVFYISCPKIFSVSSEPLKHCLSNVKDFYRF